ncbi:beta-propeller domain-containing protein [Saccharothrix obliqua]|uniref:beta-propeller domain-containing protein n=1 Tax=Saccharothrix obliqua TaxID=2861747 RepID=UPI001C5E0D35|nr:beta-propeller domain-containing protein [Saccharothrix obliqua]MBW4719896.1 beta-propeller domain-containing protein [Saccharothrix obliqua]
MTRWTWGRRVALLGGAALVAAGVVAAMPDDPVAHDRPPGRDVPVDLVAYDTCDTALTELRAAIAPHVGPYGLGGAVQQSLSVEGRAAAQPDAAKPEHSTTNVREAGVDEPDLVKTDGKRVVTVADGRLRVVDVASRALTGSLELPGGYASKLLLHGDRVLVVSDSNMALERGFTSDGFVPENGATLTLVDLAGPPAVVGSLRVAGRHLDARQIGDVVRVVVQSAPHLPWVYPAVDVPEDQAAARNREVVATSPIDAWLPSYELTAADGSRSTGRLVPCDRISHPEQHSGTSLLTVLTFDFPGELGSGDAVSVLADGDTVYSTGTSLYVADDHHLAPNANRTAAPPDNTVIYQFDITGADRPRHVASGSVRGAPLNQYALSEHDGHLRVATTSFDAPGVPEQPPASQSAVTALKRDGTRLVEVGRVDGLGVGERIHGVRFAGDTGYVVTFRRTDPLYVLDLSDPARPRRTGELKITGYSAYLHPVGDGKLIGVGQEATDQGRTQGTQVSLFDVADPTAPRRVAAHHLPGATSEVEYDPHAFLHWARRDLVVVPVSTGTTSGVLLLRLRDNAFTEIGTVRHTAGGPHDALVRRALFVGDDLWTVSAAGVRVNRADDLAERAWVSFG